MNYYFIGILLIAISVPLFLSMNAFFRVKYPTVKMLEAEGESHENAVYGFAYNENRQDRFVKLYQIPSCLLFAGVGLLLSYVMQKTGWFGAFEALATLSSKTTETFAICILTGLFSVLLDLLLLLTVWVWLTVNGNKEIDDFDRAEQKAKKYYWFNAGAFISALLSIVVAIVL